MFFHVLPLANFVRLPTRGINSDGILVDPHAVGYDLYATSDGFIDPLSRALVGLGFCASFTPGYEATLWDRSRVASPGITGLGGIIDPSYRGEWKIILYNTTAEVVRFSRGDRVGQVIFRAVCHPEPQLVSSLEESSRGSGGLGSSGR